jgi:hypothetical protein
VGVLKNVDCVLKVIIIPEIEERTRIKDDDINDLPF